MRLRGMRCETSTATHAPRMPHSRATKTADAPSQQASDPTKHGRPDGRPIGKQERRLNATYQAGARTASKQPDQTRPTARATELRASEATQRNRPSGRLNSKQANRPKRDRPDGRSNSKRAKNTPAQPTKQAPEQQANNPTKRDRSSKRVDSAQGQAGAWAASKRPDQKRDRPDGRPSSEQGNRIRQGAKTRRSNYTSARTEQNHLRITPCRSPPLSAKPPALRRCGPLDGYTGVLAPPPRPRTGPRLSLIHI